MKIIPYVLLSLLLVRLPFYKGYIDLSFFTNPLHWDGEAKRFAMLISFFFVVCVTISMKIWKHNKPLSCLFLLSMIYGFYPAYYGFSIPMLSIFTGMAWYLFWVDSNHDPLNAICIICLAHLALLFSQFYGLDPIFNLTDKFMIKTDYKHLANPFKNVGFFINRNFTSMFIAVCFPAFLRKKWCWFLPFLIFGLMISKSTGGVLATIVACFAWVFFNKMTGKTRLFFISILFFLFACFYQYIDRPDLSRFEDWKTFSKLKAEDIKPKKRNYYNKINQEKINKRPYELNLKGYGLGSFKNGKILHRTVYYTHMHNDFLEGFFEFGILVIPIYLWFFFKLFTGFRKNFLPGMALIIACVISATNYPLHNPTIAAVILVWLALFDRVQSVNA